MRTREPRRRSPRVALGSLAAALIVMAPTPALAQVDNPVAAVDQVVLSGTVDVPRGASVGEVVVFHGSADIAGVVHGDVVVLDGPVAISGLVSGTVVAMNGPIRLSGDAQVGGDVLGGARVRVAPGAQVGGTVREEVGFTLQGPLAVLGVLLGGVAVSASVLLLLAFLLVLVPRGSDRIAAAVRTAPLASLGWGVLISIALPVASLLIAATIVGLPLGLALLLGMSLLLLTGLAWAAYSVGRLLVGRERSRWLAFLAGWGVLTALGLVPLLNLVVWSLGAAWGLGAVTVASWRARGTGRGRHVAGYARPEEMATPPAPVKAPEPAQTPEPAPTGASEPGFPSSGED